MSKIARPRILRQHFEEIRACKNLPQHCAIRTANRPSAHSPQVFAYAMFDERHRQAWAGDLVYIILIGGTNTLYGSSLLDV
jgi:hypothetical protein